MLLSLLLDHTPTLRTYVVRRHPRHHWSGAAKHRTVTTTAKEVEETVRATKARIRARRIEVASTPFVGDMYRVGEPRYGEDGSRRHRANGAGLQSGVEKLKD